MIDEAKFIYYLIGLIDGEGSFYISKFHCKNLKSRIRLNPGFKIAVNVDHSSLQLFHDIKKFFGIGAVFNIRNTNGNFLVVYEVGSYKGCKKICDILDDYIEYMTIKKKTYQIWREIIYRLLDKEHLTQRGFEKILELKSKISRTKLLLQ